MAGESLVIRQKTLFRLSARPAPSGVRAARPCASDRRTTRSVVTPARVRIQRSVRPEVAKVIRESRRFQALLTHTLNCYARPEKAGGASLAGDLYAQAAARGDLRMLRDVLVLAHEIERRIDSVITPSPTRALPGTPEKVEVMAERHKRLMDLHHERDARRDD